LKKFEKFNQMFISIYEVKSLNEAKFYIVCLQSVFKLILKINYVNKQFF